MDAIDPIIEGWRARVLDAGRTGRALVLRGGGSKDFYGGVPVADARGAGQSGASAEADLLDTRLYAGVVAYEPTELYVTARCGTPLAELEALLGEKGQMFAFEPPHFGAGATVGGMFAAGLSGPRRPSAGALRDYVLGLRLLDGQGRLLNFGGQVMKNVAGYDVSRMLAGSLGVLGIVTEVTLKLLPRPVEEATLRFELGEDAALAVLNRWGGQPLPISASAWEGGVLTVRLSGQRAAVRAAREQLGGERVDDADAFWAALREQTAPFFRPLAAGEALWRLSLPTTAPAFRAGGAAVAASAAGTASDAGLLPLPPAALQALASAPQLVEWGGGQRWLHAPAEAGPALRAAASALGGHATLFRGTDAARAAGVFTHPGAALMRVHAGLKAEFDPARVFNRARLFPEL
ncbi:glycolate oxidase subunit GlcE [Derxia gummosa]|uniref:Glycolate oxidase subunit GlcE n=1 Tax=Derxia gummosa DSM 723 TaxID=1121388 RepID=A0A8B6X366_9BURK|nr:glycolate oxidase subunit GlcE [Derxia gummosa]